MSIPNGNIIIAIRIEALGTSIAQLFFCDRVPSFEVTLPGNKPTWRPVLKRKQEDGDSGTGGIPSFSSSSDFKTGASTAANINFELVLFDDNSGNNEDIYRLFHNHLRPVAVDTLSVAISAADTTIVFASGSPGLVNNDIIWIGREAIQLGPETVPGTYDPCTRGIYETVATEHDAANGQDVTIFDKWVTPQGRRVTLGYLPPDKAFDATASSVDFIPIWSGTINEMGSTDAGNTLMIETTGLGVLAANTQLYPRRWRGRVSAEGHIPGVALASGGTSQSKNPRVVQVLPRGDSDAFFPLAMGVAAEGDQAWVRFQDTAVVMELTNLTPVTYQLDVLNKLKWVSQPDFGSAKTNDAVWEILSTDPDWPGAGIFPQLSFGASRNPKYGDIFTVLLQVLTSIARGPSQNGPYDTGIRFGIGLPFTQLAIAEIEALRGDYGGRATCKSLYVGIDPEPANALQWVQEHLLAPYALVMALNADALWTVKALKDLPDDDPPTITELDLFGGVAISYSQAIERAVDVVEFAYQGSATGETKQLDFVNETVRERRLNEAGVLNYSAIGLDDDAQAQYVGQTAVHRWRDTVPEFEFSTQLQVNGAGDALEVGDPFNITSVQLPNVDTATGIPFRGVTDMICYVTGRTTHLEGPAARFDYRAMQWGLGQGNIGRISIGLEVVAGFVYVDGSGEIEFTPTLYQSPKSDGYRFDKDVEPVQIDWVLKHMSEFLESIDTGLVVGSIDIPNNKITFSTYPVAWDSPTNTPPVAGDLMHNANWGILTEDSQKKYVAQANAVGELSGGDPGFLWIRG